MRVALAFLVVGALWTGGAEASSFVALEPLKAGSSPSIIVLGAPASAAAVVAERPARVAAAKSAQAPAVPSSVADDDRPSRRFEIPRDEIVKLSPSVIAFGEPEVSAEKVAAIGAEAPKPHHISMPMVIRGGEVGGLSGTGVSMPAPAARQPQQASTAGGHPGQPKPTEHGPDQQPAAPPPQVPPTGPILKPE